MALILLKPNKVVKMKQVLNMDADLVQLKRLKKLLRIKRYLVYEKIKIDMEDPFLYVMSTERILTHFLLKEVGQLLIKNILKITYLKRLKQKKINQDYGKVNSYFLGNGEGKTDDLIYIINFYYFNKLFPFWSIKPSN